LSTGAELLCLDEPAAGLTPTEIDALGRVITAVRDTGRSVLLIEHHLSFVTDICDRVVLLARGHVSAEETLGESRTLSTPELIDYFTKTDSVTVAPSDAIDVATTGTEDVR
jgi:ABC-type branched-subunit amino acid transport system ATPase component